MSRTYGIALLTLFVALASLQALIADDRATVIDFEDEVVEGVNKKPLDSLSQVSEKGGRNGVHLYRKRAGFRSENEALLKELSTSQ